MQLKSMKIRHPMKNSTRNAKFYIATLITIRTPWYQNSVRDKTQKSKYLVA